MPISSIGTSSQPPPASREAWWSLCRKASDPMKMPFSLRRSTAYHMVVASSEPRMRSHGRGGALSTGEATPASTSCLYVAT